MTVPYKFFVFSHSFKIYVNLCLFLKNSLNGKKINLL